MTEKLFRFLIIGAFIIIWGLSFFTSIFQPDFFEYIVQEDGWIENCTVVIIFAALLMMVWRFIRLVKIKSWLWRGTTFLIIALLTFGFGEEISWGQRIFDLPSNDFFAQHNTQQEINLHNLKLGGIKLNFLISQTFTVAFSLYLLLLPYLYRKKEKMATWVDHAGLPIPKTSQILGIFLPLLLVLVMPHSQKWEVLEISLALGGFWILSFPINKNKIYLEGKKP